MSLENIDEMDIAQEVTERLQERMMLEWPGEGIEENLHILTEFNKIAAGSIKTQGQIAISGNNSQAIPLDERLLGQAVNLFGEAMYHSLVKFREFSIPYEAKLEILQVGLAAYLLEQSQITVATTFGQEHTPEFQVSPDQQIELMRQTAENALLHFINEYEQKHGPIHPQNITQEVTQKFEAVEAPMAPEYGEYADYGEYGEEQSIPVAAPPVPSQPKGPTPHDKYAAVALLLGTLPNQQRINLLRHFNTEEKELITYYSLEAHIEQNLDLSYVEAHLKRFRQMLGQGASSLRSQASREIEAMARELPAEVLLSWVKYERPLVHTYLSQYLNPDDKTSGASSAKAQNAVEPRHLAGNLPPRIEEVLCQYLTRQRAS